MALPNYRVAQTDHGGPPSVRQYTAGATTVAGNLVLMQDDGKVDPIAADAAHVLGVALEASADTETVLVALATPGTIFSATVKSGTYATTLVGEFIQTDTDGVDVDQAAADNAARLLGLDETDDDSTGTRRVLIDFPSANSQAPGGDIEA
jgi:hypothetical protein